MNTTRRLIGPVNFITCPSCRDFTWLAGPEEARRLDVALFKARHAERHRQGEPARRKR